MNLLGIYTVGVARSLCRRLLLGRKLSIVRALSTTFTQYAPEITKLGKNRKPIYDFLLVINTNLPPILHRFGDTAFQK